MLFTGMDVSLSLPPSLSKKEMKKCPLVRIKKRERERKAAPMVKRQLTFWSSGNPSVSYAPWK